MNNAKHRQNSYRAERMRYQPTSDSQGAGPSNLNGPGRTNSRLTDIERPKVERPAHLAPHGPSPPFFRLVALFEWCIKKKLELRRRYLATWIDNWRRLVGPDLYPVMRLLLPQKDRERATYGFKEAALAKAFINAFGMNEKSKDAQNLIHWKRPGDDTKAVGDFPTILFQTVGARSSVEVGKLTVEDVNNLLDDLARSWRIADTAERKALAERVIRDISNKCTPNELRWVTRIILKDLNIGMKENTVFAVFHQDATDLYNSSSDLQKICYDLADPNHRLNAADKQIALFTPFQPMLCGRSNSTTEAFRLMTLDKSEPGFIMEEKLDGERIQLHKRGNEFFFCSRKGKDYTYLYGSDIGKGSLTPFIKDAFHPQLTDLILDGEMMVWDPDLEKYLPFGHLKTAALESLQQLKPDGPHPCFKVFDVLYIRVGNAPEPTVLSDKTLAVRLGVLKDAKTTPDGRKIKLFREVPNRIEFALQREGHTLQDVKSFLQEVVEDRGEGLVLKKPKTSYTLAGRDAKKWVKVKPEYMDDMGETVDVLVVGAMWGRGHRGGRISSLICAVRAEHIPERNGHTVYSTFVRIGTGLSFDEYNEINKKNWKPFNRDRPPFWMILSDLGSADDKGDLYIEPEDSFIISIKAASIHVSDQFGTGLNMRFPRCQAIRRDMAIDECLTYGELLHMATSTKKRKGDDDEEEEQVRPKKRKVVRKKTTAISAMHKGTDLKDVEVQGDLFEGMIFHVIPSRGGRLSKPEVETLIHEHGGKVTQKFGTEGATIIYGGEVDVPVVARTKSKGEKDILKPEWIEACIEASELVPLRKKFFFFATDERQKDPIYRSRPSASDGQAQDDDEDEEDEGEATDPEADDDDFVAVAVPQVQSVEDDEGEATDPEEEDDAPLPRDEETLGWIGVSDNDAAPESTSSSARQSKTKKQSKRLFLRDGDEDGDSTASEAGEDEDDDDEAEYDFGVLSDSDSSLPKPKPLEEGRPAASPNGRDGEPMQIHRSPPRDEDVTMGEDEEAMEYDSESLFKHLVIYLDTPTNARAQNMPVTVSETVQANAAKEFSKVEALIGENGGRVTSNLEDPKLTHVVLFKRDTTRRVALMRRTSTPKRRHLVVSSWVVGSVQEETLLSEDLFAP